jgi:hypothetical protein
MPLAEPVTSALRMPSLMLFLPVAVRWSATRLRLSCPRPYRATDTDADLGEPGVHTAAAVGLGDRLPPRA